MSRSVVPQVIIPTIEELESASSSEQTVTKKTNAFTRFRQSAASNSFPDDDDSSVKSKRKRQEEAGCSVEDGSSEEAPPLFGETRRFSDEVAPSLFGESKKISEPRPSGSSVIVSPRQKGNPLLRFLRNVPYEFGETSADYVLGESCCALFLSLKFHKLHPDYVHERLKSIGRAYNLQVLLVQVDVPEPSQVLRELNTICFNADWTLMLAWNPEEAAELLESYKIYKNKPPDFLMGRQEVDPRAKLIDLLTNIRSITRTDAANLIATFGSLKNMVEATEEQLALCPGLGVKKAKRLYHAFVTPWRNGKNGDEIASVTTSSEIPGTSVANTEPEIDADDLFD